jgi:hypothetical protein
MPSTPTREVLLYYKYSTVGYRRDAAPTSYHSLTKLDLQIVRDHNNSNKMTALTSTPSQSVAIVTVDITKSRKMNKRKVSFSKKKEYFAGQDESMIQELVNTIWYTAKEYTAFRKEAQDSKRAIAKGKSCECVRGVEHIVCPLKKALRRT